MHTYSVKPSHFSNRSSYDSNLVEFWPSDPWVPVFKYKNNPDSSDIRIIYDDEINALMEELVTYQIAYPHVWWMYIVFAFLCYLPWTLWKSKGEIVIFLLRDLRYQMTFYLYLITSLQA